MLSPEPPNKLLEDAMDLMIRHGSVDTWVLRDLAEVGLSSVIAHNL